MPVIGASCAFFEPVQWFYCAVYSIAVMILVPIFPHHRLPSSLRSTRFLSGSWRWWKTTSCGISFAALLVRPASVPEQQTAHPPSFSFPSTSGVYHDNPHSVPAAKCRALVGFLTKRQLTEEERDRMAALGFRVRDVPTTQCRTTVFPFRKYLGPLSFMFAAIFTYSSIGQQLG